MNRDLADVRASLWENIAQSSRAPICAFDLEFRITAFNRAHSDEFYRIYGHRVRVGEVFPDLFLPEQASVIRGFMARALRGERFSVVEEFGDPDLDRPYWEIVYTPLRDADGRVVGAFHWAQDISARLRAESLLADARLRLVVEGARDHVILTADAEGKIASWSVGAEAILGWTAAEAIGRPTPSSSPPRTAPRAWTGARSRRPPARAGRATSAGT